MLPRTCQLWTWILSWRQRQDNQVLHRKKMQKTPKDLAKFWSSADGWVWMFVCMRVRASACVFMSLPVYLRGCVYDVE